MIYFSCWYSFQWLFWSLCLLNLVLLKVSFCCLLFCLSMCQTFLFLCTSHMVVFVVVESWTFWVMYYSNSGYWFPSLLSWLVVICFFICFVTWLRLFLWSLFLPQCEAVWNLSGSMNGFMELLTLSTWKWTLCVLSTTKIFLVFILNN